METIISKPVKKIMELFRKNLKDKIHFREICRKTNLNENTASKTLKKLYEETILNFEKRGNLKEYFLENNKKTHSILSLLDSEKFEKLPKIRKKSIKIYLKNLKEKPLIVILFGSTSKENFNIDSDIDLFLIVNRKINDDEAKKISESQTGIEINTFQKSMKDFELENKIKEDNLFQTAIKTGYPLENSSMFYGEILK